MCNSPSFAYRAQVRKISLALSPFPWFPLCHAWPLIRKTKQTKKQKNKTELYESLGIAVPSCHNLGGFKQQQLIPHSSGGHTFEKRCWQVGSSWGLEGECVPVSGGGREFSEFLGLQLLHSHLCFCCHRAWCPVCVCVCVQFSRIWTPAIRLGLTLMRWDRILITNPTCKNPIST